MLTPNSRSVLGTRHPIVSGALRPFKYCNGRRYLVARRLCTHSLDNSVAVHSLVCITQASIKFVNCVSVGVSVSEHFDVPFRSCIVYVCVCIQNINSINIISTQIQIYTNLKLYNLNFKHK